MKKVNVILAMLMIAFGATQASAQHKKREHRPHPKEMFKKLDTNKDEKISKEEAKQTPHKHLFENFDKIDLNKDGYIEKSELEEGRKLRRAEKMKAVDTNKDGKISIDEMLAFKKQHLIKADKNNNGFLEPEELKAMRKHRKGNHCRGEKSCKK